MFEKATRLKLRFETSRGLITVEDLWDLPLTSNSKVNLDDLAKDLFRRIKEEETTSFVVKNTKADDVLQLKFDIIKHIIDVRLAENAATKEAADKRDKKQKLLAILERKQNEQLESASAEEIQKMIAEL